LISCMLEFTVIRRPSTPFYALARPLSGASWAFWRPRLAAAEGVSDRWPMAQADQPCLQRESLSRGPRQKGERLRSSFLRLDYECLGKELNEEKEFFTSTFSSLPAAFGEAPSFTSSDVVGDVDVVTHHLTRWSLSLLFRHEIQTVAGDTSFSSIR